MVSPSMEDNRSLTFKPKCPHFFKIILGSTISETKLYIPRKFARVYGDDLSSIFLKVPNGKKWDVELVKSDGEIWLENGWPEFMEYYSIALGDFLVFAYDQKTCCFNVIIFDKSATEIDYPINGDNKEPDSGKGFQKPKNQESDNVEESVEILGHTSPSQKEKGESPEQFLQPYEEIKVETSTEQVEGRTDFEVKKGNGETSNNRKRYNRIVSGKRLTHNDKVNVIRRAKTKYATKNPYFMIAMNASSVDPVYKGASIPASFAKKYLHKDYYNANLSVLDSGTWSVEFKIRVSCGNLRARILSHGWKKFAKANHLEMGDVCIFEPINFAKTTYKVTIFPNSKVENCCSSAFGAKEFKEELIEMLSDPIILPGATETAKNFTSTHLFFRVVIRSYHLTHRYLCVPREFVAKYAKQSSKNVMLEVKSRQWPVKLIRCPHYNRGMFSAGWNSFAMENSLQVGDTCIFELINAKTGIMKVSIFRHS